MTVQHRQNLFLDTSSVVAASQWDELLRLQVDLFFPYELDWLADNEAWKRARDILDVGCGNGYYLSKLKALHADKTYHGMDVSAELITLAKQQHRAPGIEFATGDFLKGEIGRRYDAILLRFVVQHLDSFSLIAERAAAMLRPGGTVIIIEPNFAQSRIWPAAPLFTGLLAAFEQRQDTLGRLRAHLGELPAMIDQLAGWRIAYDRSVFVPAVGPFRGTKTIATFQRWIDLCERVSGLDYPFDDTRSEIAQWSDGAATYSRIALRITQIAFEPEPAALVN